MGSKCSSFEKGEKNGGNRRKHKKEEVSTIEKVEENSPPFQRRPLQEEVGHLEVTSAEQTSCRRAEDTSSGKDDSSSLTQEYVSTEMNDQSSSLSDPSAAAEKKEADWVDTNRPELIQNISLALPIADLMLQRGIIHKEMYTQIKTTRKSQDQMREIYSALTCTKAKSAFYRILQEINPQIIKPEDFIKEVIKRNKDYLRTKCMWQLEGTEKSRQDEKPLDKIFTELHIVQGVSEHVNKQHEIWEIEDKSRSNTAEGIKINCNDIFKTTREGTALCERDRRDVRAIRTVMTKGIAGIGKTVSVKKFILDWADGKANQDLDFIFMFPFRELNLVIDEELSLEMLVRDFHPELSDKAAAKIFAEIKTHQVLFIFDGLDESQLQLKFKNTKILTDHSKKSSVDTLVTNLIREHLLPDALVWITSRPGAIERIPQEYVYLWTEVRGFNDPQKILYFRNRVEDEVLAERIISLITMSRSLFIMCHIPIFCWITSKVLEYLLSKTSKTQDESINTPTTLTEMYSHFFLIQMTVANEKYVNEDKTDTAEIFRSNEEFILKLGRMAFEKLDKGEIIFSGDDLKKYGIDLDKAEVHCGLCTSIFRVENVFNRKKLYCFVHLTVQEYLASLFVYHSFARKSIDSQSLKNFLLIGSEEELESILNKDPVDLPLNELMEIAIANSTLRKTGELDMFLRFLIGLSLQSTQQLLQGLIEQTEEHSEVVEEIGKSLQGLDLYECSPERCLNLVHCLVELKDSSIHDKVQKYLKSNQGPESQLSPVECSALANAILMSNTPLDEFNLTKYKPATKGAFRLLPAVRNSRKVIISGESFDSWICETIASALQMPNSVLTELHLINNTFFEREVKILAGALIKTKCKLEAFSVSGRDVRSLFEAVAPDIEPVISNLRELELGNVYTDLLLSVISVGLSSPKLEKLRLKTSPGISKICKEIVKAFTTNPSNLRHLELSCISFEDAEMETLSNALMSINCNLGALRKVDRITTCITISADLFHVEMMEILPRTQKQCFLSALHKEIFLPRLSHNKLTVKGCQILATALSSRPSPLRELDLSYNDLYASGLMALCNALMSPHCVLETLRLSFCKVTGDECSSVASALKSDHCKLRELDLSFNYLTDQQVKVLTEIQEDSRCSLKYLNVDHNEEFWVDLKLLRQYACDLTLDPNTAGNQIILTKENKMATYSLKKQLYPDHPDRFNAPQVLCKEGLSGRHYWEVHSVSGGVGVTYKSIPRNGDCSVDFSLGANEKSWCWDTDGGFCHSSTPQTFLVSNTRNVGVYLDWPAGILSFFEVFPEALTHLYTVHETFTEPLHPCFSLHSGSVDLRIIHDK